MELEIGKKYLMKIKDNKEWDNCVVVVLSVSYSSYRFLNLEKNIEGQLWKSDIERYIFPLNKSYFILLNL